MNKIIERPILMSGPMVRAILEDRKVMTRRLDGLDEVNNYPGTFTREDGRLPRLGYRGLVPNEYYIHRRHKLDYRRNPGLYHWFTGLWVDTLNVIPVKCPYGQPGDHLWVRETWADNIPGCPGGLTYRADHLDQAGDGPANPIRWKPSIHMPRRASRITLEITGVRVERLQAISGEDAIAEGVNPDLYDLLKLDHGATDKEVVISAFAKLWQSINGKRPGYDWAANPWVFVITFKRVIP